MCYQYYFSVSILKYIYFKIYDAITRLLNICFHFIGYIKLYKVLAIASKYCYLLPVFFYLNFEIRININIINNENKTYHK